jgi:hypothetical protein
VWDTINKTIVNDNATGHTVNCSTPALENVFSKWMIT